MLSAVVNSYAYGAASICDTLRERREVALSYLPTARSTNVEASYAQRLVEKYGLRLCFNLLKASTDANRAILQA
ncbi:hypothetical protein [Nostoc sp.]|uniref:hypothetical protein n=1 Tax=Nostoc sp. TaxID=1180 RepID=UPI002FF57388